MHASEPPPSDSVPPIALTPRAIGRLSQMPPGQSAQRLALRLLSEAELSFVTAMRDASLLGELHGEEMLAVATQIGDGADRRVELLEAYYRAGGDAIRATTRARVDRFFLQRADRLATLPELVATLADLVPEIGGIKLARAFGDDGDFVLESADDRVALVDEEEDDDFDAKDTISLRAVMRAVNVLMERRGVRERFVSLCGDEVRELYAAVGVTEAVALANAGCLEDTDPTAVMQLGSW